MAKTIKWNNDTDWLQFRKQGIGGSDISTICSINKYHTPLQIWYDKITPDYYQEDNEAMWWGRELEPIIAKRFTERTGKKVAQTNCTYVDDEFEFFHANIDRKVLKESALLECKSTNSMMSQEWEYDNIPDMYLLQLQWYLMITGFKKAYIACLLGDKTFIYKQCERNEELIKEIRQRAYDFWTKYVIPHIQPPAQAGDEKLLNMIYETNDYIKDLSDYGFLIDRREDLIYDIKEQDNKLKGLKREKEDIDAQIIQLLEGSNEAESGIYNIKKKKSVSHRIDTAQLKKLYPDIAKELTKETETNKLDIQIGGF